MRTLSRVGLFVSAYFGLGCAGMDFGPYRRAHGDPSSGSVDVVVAIQSIEVGVPISPEDVEVRSLPAVDVDEEATFARLEDVLGHSPTELILEGEPVREERLRRGSDAPALEGIIQPGTLAFALPLESFEGYSPLLEPGNYVDVLWTADPESTGDTQDRGARILLQAIQILAVGPNLVGVGGVDARGGPALDTITLGLRPEELSRLLLARATGSILVGRRSDIDILTYRMDPVTTADLRTPPAETPEEPPEEPPALE